MRPETLIVTLAVVSTLLAGPAAASHRQSSELTISAQDMDEYLPRSAFNSTHNEYLVVWHDDSGFQSRSIMGKRLDRWGNTIAEFVVAFDATRDSAQPTVAYDPVHDRYLVVFIRDYFGDGSDWDVYGRLIPATGPSASLPEFSINTWSSHQWNPKAGYASTQQEFFVAWTNEAASVPLYISGQRISPADGGALGSTITIATGGQHRFDPELAYNHTRNEYLIVFTLMNGTQGDIYAVRMNAGGSILGGGEFGVAAWPDSEEAPKVAASPSADKYLVAWHSIVGDKDVYARFVNGDGSVDGAPILVASTSVDEATPAVGCLVGSTRCLVAWSQQYSNATGPFGISARSLASDHALGVPVSVRPIYSGETIACTRPTIIGAGGAWFAVWEHERQAGGYLDIHGRVVYDPFSDGFENGGTAMWSVVVP